MADDPAVKAIQDFAEITGVDEGLAHFFLQDFDFDLEKGLNAYFQELNRNQRAENGSEADSDDSDSDVEVMDTSSPKEDCAQTATVAQSSNSDQFPDEVTVMTWNIDGLDEGNLITRLKGALIIIAKVNPEILLLQEVVKAHMDKIRELMGPMYNIVAPVDDGMPYFTVTCVSKNIIPRLQEIKPFGNTMMGRTMTFFEGYWQKLRIVIIHSHLESTKDYVAVRKAQFNECIKKFEQNIGTNTLVLFGGDLNIRDTEIDTFHPAIKDAWIAAGSDKKTEYTWDCKLNTNKALPHFIRCRFDRIYYNGPYKKVEFALHGTQQIKNIQRYPSDHFAAVAVFRQPQN